MHRVLCAMCALVVTGVVFLCLPQEGEVLREEVSIDGALALAISAVGAWQSWKGCEFKFVGQKLKSAGDDESDKTADAPEVISRAEDLQESLSIPGRMVTITITVVDPTAWAKSRAAIAADTGAPLYLFVDGKHVTEGKQARCVCAAGCGGCMSDGADIGTMPWVVHSNQYSRQGQRRRPSGSGGAAVGCLHTQSGQPTAAVAADHRPPCGRGDR